MGQSGEWSGLWLVLERVRIEAKSRRLCTWKGGCVMTPNLFFAFLYLTSCITTAVIWLTTLPSLFCFCLPMTHSDSVLIRHCDSVLVLLFRDSLWLPYYTLTQDESSTVHWLTMSRSLIVYSLYCLQDSLFSDYYKYRRLWSLRPQTWLLVSYGTTANTPSSLITSL